MIPEALWYINLTRDSGIISIRRPGKIEEEPTSW
jgi:hypothetical protein